MDQESTVKNQPTAAEPAEVQESAPQPEKAPKKKRKAKRAVPKGKVYVLATFNNTIITITDPKGNKLSSASAGSSGFRGSKKSTAYAAQVAAEKAITDAKQNYGVSTVEVLVKGVGLGRDAAIRTLTGQRLNVENVQDVTGIPHGGVRPRRPKRN